MLIPLREATQERCGGKAAGLRALLDAGLPVPEGYCLDTGAYRAALPAALPDPATPLRAVAAACGDLATALARWEPSSALRDALTRACAELGAPLALRSSASCEDQAGRSAAGLFVTTLELRALPALVAAVRASWASLWQPAAWAALRAWGRSPHDEAMAVVLQRQVRARHSGFAASHDSEDPSRLRIEATGGPPLALAQGTAVPSVLLLPRAGPARAAMPGPAPLLAPRILEALRAALLRSEQAFGAAVELEWVDDGERLWVVQARRAPPLRPAGQEDTRWGAGAAEGGDWRWDREHNPEPLSAAHASFVTWLDRQLGGPPRLAVREGYLFTAVAERADPDPPASTAAVEDGAFAAALAGLATPSPQLATTARDGPEGSRAAALSALERALTDFKAFYLRYQGAPVALRRRAQAALEQGLAACGVAAPAERATALSLGAAHQAWLHSAALWRLARAAREDPALQGWLADDTATAVPPAVDAYLRDHGVLAARWDVAEPTFAESSAEGQRWLRARLLGAPDDDPLALVAAQRARADAALSELLQGLPTAARRRLERQVASARQARASAEDDDWYFARALWPLRAAWLQAGAALVSCGALATAAQVFELPLERLLTALSDDPPPPTLRAEAEAGAALRRARSRLRPPLAISAGRCHWGMPSACDHALRGIGCGGTGQGPVRVLHDPAALLTQDLRGLVLVCPTLTPALAPALAQLAGLVTDHGGRLSHAALLAREQGLPAVVGTGSATQSLREGEWVWLDGARGLVVPLERETQPTAPAGELL